MQVRSGSLSYLNQVHKQLGIWTYTMQIIRKWSDGKYTVLFQEKDDEAQTKGTAQTA